MTPFPPSLAHPRTLKVRSPISTKAILKGYGLLCGVLLCFFQPAHAQSIDFVDAKFSVQFNNTPTDGKNFLKIKRDHHRYDVDFELDHWLASASQKATFEMDHCKVRPISYVATSKRPLKEETRQTLEFDWTHKKAEYKGKDEQKSFNLDTAVYDPISFFFEARCDLMAGKKQFSYSLINKGRQNTQTYKVIGTQKVETGLGEFETLIVERVRDSKKRQTRLYVAPDLDYLLVKIEHQEGRLLNVVATLKSMDYRLTDTSK
ncbi:DUF3108 domain-containing protein [Pusillimonas sp. ANT_WB101]|uniref:DUF3108 domain-containing protein n=1 Tax=Pusillimonas sp. ANT_WB101 TaxID=2597356 RepID=UPI00165D60AA|nr:DUF3108 domain-containing protein [Pusillimonas sp. ANT_WB101]